MDDRGSPKRAALDGETRRLLGALGWSSGDPRIIACNMLHKCLTANLPGLSAVLRRHFEPDGRGRDPATGRAVTDKAEYLACIRSAIHELIELVRREHGSLDLLARSGPVRSVKEVMAILQSERSGG